MGFSFCAYFSMASGLLILPAIIGAIILQGLSLREFKKQDFVSILLLGILFLAVFLARPIEPAQNHLVAKSVLAFIYSLGKSLAWPFSEKPLMAVPMFAPTIMLIGYYLKNRKTISREDLFVLAIGFWVIIQAVAIAYVRGADGNSPANRYVETLKFSPLINLLVLFVLAKEFKNWQYKNYFFLACGGWAGIAILGLLSSGLTVFSNGLPGTYYFNQEAKINISNYLQTRDRSHLENKPFFMITHISVDKLIKFLEDETLRDLIPITAEGTDSRLRAGKLRPLTEGLMNAGQWILLLGIVLLIGTSIIGWVNRDRFP